MTRDEFLKEKYSEFAKNYSQSLGIREFYANPSIARIDPFKIADNLYYVGDKKVCIHLIDTGEGLILLDSGCIGAQHLLVDSIWRAGFDPKNLRLIIHSHEHTDHFGASEELRNMYGAKLAISRVGANALKEKDISTPFFPYAKAPSFDCEIEDGEIIELGNTKIRCILTPGHAEGVMSFFFEVTCDGKSYLAGMFGGAGVNAIKLPNMHHNGTPTDAPYKMLESIDKIYNEPVEIHLGNHPGNNKTLEKRQKQLTEGTNPFISKDSWHEFLDGLRETVKKIIAENEEMEKMFE